MQWIFCSNGKRKGNINRLLDKLIPHMNNDQFKYEVINNFFKEVTLGEYKTEIRKTNLIVSRKRM